MEMGCLDIRDDVMRAVMRSNAGMQSVLQSSRCLCRMDMRGRSDRIVSNAFDGIIYA